MARDLGALYKFDAFDDKTLNALRSMLTSMDDCVANAAQRFFKEYDKKVTHVASPCFSSEEWVQLGEELGRFSYCSAEVAPSRHKVNDNA